MLEAAPIDNRMTKSRDLSWQRSFQHHKWMFLGSIAFFLICLVAIASVRPSFVSIQLSNLMDYTFSSVLFLVIYLVLLAGAIVVQKGFPASPLTAAWQHLSNNQLSYRNLPNVFFVWLSLVIVISAFLAMKIMIPHFNPFAWDAAFIEADRLLHFGTQPWEWLAPITHNFYITKFLHLNYYIWFPVIYFTFFWQACSQENPVLRLQFTMAFVMSWAIVGTGMATMFSSVGPIFLDRLPGGDANVYAGALSHLQNVHAVSPMGMFDISEQLWTGYTQNLDKGLVLGISAMPSMHVALAYLMLLLGLKKGGFAKVFYSIYFVLIFVGSISLLWHYAVDGYVSILTVTAIWYICGKIARSAHAVSG